MNDPRLGRVIGVHVNEIFLEIPTPLFLRAILRVNAETIKIGENVWLSPNLQIGLPGKRVELFETGDNVVIHEGIVAPRRFKCGDYVTIHEGVWAYGRNDIVIGHNAWFGKRCTLDAEGGFRVGNGFGAGQDSHMWSHIRHGDTLAGCRYLSFGKFIADDDVWLVGRCTSAPAHHGTRSVAMVESNLTKGMEPNTVWGGNPAKDLTDKLGRPYLYRDIVERMEAFNDRVQLFLADNPDVDEFDLLPVQSTFDVGNRTYHKTGSVLEERFMRYLLPEAKFVPRGAEVVAL